MENTWPNGLRKAMDQSEHERWNSYNYPGTRQLCELCGEHTERCEEDAIYLDDKTVCIECYKLGRIEHKGER